MAKLWGGRFSKSTDVLVDDFNSSIRFDCRMYAQDIAGSVAHAEMLGRQGITSSFLWFRGLTAISSLHAASVMRTSVQTVSPSSLRSTLKCHLLTQRIFT